MTRRHEHWMNEAIALAVENVRLGSGGPFGALVVKDDRIVGSGVNLVTSTNDPTAHAEVVAIRAACRSLDVFELGECEIYSSCEPCPMCLAAIFWARLSGYYFASTRLDAAKAGFDDTLTYQQVNLPAEQRFIRSARVIPEQGEAPFREWAQSTRKVLY